MPGKKTRTTIQFDRDFVAEFSKWTDGEGRRVAPTAASILRWFLKQDELVQQFILGKPAVAAKLAESLEAMADAARRNHPSHAAAVNQPSS